MSKTIDQKVVEMRFENAQFEKGVAQSMNSLDKLKQSLNFDELSNVGAKGLSDSISGIGSSVENISEKFTAFGIMAMASLAKVSEKLVEFGLSIKDNLVESIVEGYSKYNTLMESVQTIMYATRQDWADTGRQMSYVSDQIAELNWYTDETSYNLTDMTSNIGKFVSAGVSLEDAKTAMMGISSWAAISGQKADAASRAMYNLSQALSLGAVTTIDWKSIEMANMATREFKDTVIQTALELGKLHYDEVEDIIYGYDQYGHKMTVTIDNFRSTLAGKWFDADVLTGVLKKYGDFADGLYGYVNKTGLTATEFLGYIDEYKKGVESGQDMSLWISQVATENGIKNISAFKAGLIELSSSYNELGRQAFMAGQECKTFEDVVLAVKDATTSAWMGIFTAIFGNYQQSKELWTAVAEEMYDIMVEGLNTKRRLLESWNLVGGRDHLINALWNVWYAIKDVFSAFEEGFNKIFPQKNAIYWSNLMGDFERFTEKLRLVDFPWAPQLTNIQKSAENLATGFKNILDNLKALAKQAEKAWSRIFPDTKPLGKKQSELIDGILNLTEGFKNFTENLKFTDSQLDKIERSFAGLFAILDILKMLFIAIITPLTNFRTGTINLTDPILDVTSSIGDWLVALRDWIAENDIFTKAVAQVIEWISQIPVYAEMASQALFGLSLNELWDKIVEGATYALGAVVYFFTHLPELAEEACQLLFHTDLATFWESLKAWVQETWDAILEFFEQLPEKISSVTEFMFQSDFHTWWENIKTWVGEAWDKVQEFFANLPSYIDLAKHKISELWDLVKKFFNEEIPAKLDEIAQKLFHKSWAEVLNDITDAIQKLKDAWNDFWGIGEKFNPPEYEELDPNKQWFLDAAWYRNLGKEMTAPKSGIEKLKEKWEDFMDIIGKDLGTWFSEHNWEVAGVAGFVAFAAIIFGLAYLVKSMISLCKTIEDFDLPDLFESSTTSLIGSMDNFLEALTGLTKKFSGVVPMLQFKLVADSILEVVAAIFLLGMMDTAELWSSIGVLIAVLAAIFSVFYASQEFNVVQMKAIANSMLEIGLTMLLVAGAIALVGQLETGKIIAATTALTILLGGMAAALLVVGKLQWGVAYLGAMKEIAESFVLMGVAIMALGVAMAVMGDLDPVQMITAATALSILLAAMTGAIVLVSKMSIATTEMIAFGGAVALIGLGAALAASSIWIIVDAIEKLSNIGPEGINNIIYGITSFFSVLPQLATNVGEAIVAFVKVFVDNKDTLLAGLQLMLDLIVTSIIGVMPKIIELGTQIFIGLLQAGIDSMPKIVEFLYTLFDTIVDLTIGWTPRIIDTLIFVVRELLRSMVVLTPEITAAALAILVDTLRQLAENIGVITQYLIQILLETILGTIDGITAEIPHIMESIWNFVITLIETFADGLDEHAVQLRDAIVHLMVSVVIAIKEFLGINSPSTVFFDIAGDMIQGMINGIADFLKPAVDAITKFADKVLTAICDKLGIEKPKSAQEFFKIATEGITNFISGIGDMIDSAAKKIRELADKVLTAICDRFGIKKPESLNEFLNIGKTSIQNFNQGIYTMISKAKTMIQDFAKRVLDAICEKLGVKTPSDFGELYSVAQQVINGFISGIKSRISSAINTVGGFCEDVISTCKDIFKVASPSKVFIEIGKFLDEGLAVGIDKYANTVSDSSEDMAYAAVDTVSNAIASIADLVDEQMDANPTIRPVLDLTDVVNGAGAINDMLSSDRAVKLAASSNMDVNSKIAAANAPSVFDELRATLGNIAASDNRGVVQNNTFNISGTDPREMADEINKILQEQMVRGNAVWA